MDRTMTSLYQLLVILSFAAAAVIAIGGRADARGMTAPAMTKPPGGNVGGWLGDGPIFGFDDPFGEGLWEHGWQGGMPYEGNGGSRGFGSGGTGGTGGGGVTPNSPKDCWRQVPSDDYSTVLIEPDCNCKLKIGKWKPQPGTYVEGTCAPSGGWSTLDECTRKGDCCAAPYYPATGA